jgi:bacterioferritin (cytochrome b1)
VGIWERVRDLTAGPQRRILADLVQAYHEELRVALQLRLHAERVPYPESAVRLLAMADHEDAHAARVRERITALGGVVTSSGAGTPRGGRNYWERLTFDLEDMRVKGKHNRELSIHWDVEDAETAQLFARLADEDHVLCRIIGDLIARSDPHAED